MSSVDIELVEKLGLTKKVLGGYLGVTSQSFGQGLQATKRYLDDQRLAALYRGLESDGHTDKLVLVEQYIIDAEAFGAAVKTLRIQGGPLGKEAGSLTSNYVWFLKQTDRITEEWPMLESVISGEAPYQLIIATSDHCIKSVSHGQIARSVIESRYLAQASRPEAYQTSQGNIALVSTELDLFMPELLIPNVDPYANQPGYVHTKNGFQELPAAMVGDLAETVYWEFLPLEESIIEEKSMDWTWNSGCLPYLKALKLFLDRQIFVSGKAESLWDAMANSGYISSINWAAIAKQLELTDAEQITIELQNDKRLELRDALGAFIAMGLEGKFTEGRFNQVIEHSS